MKKTRLVFIGIVVVAITTIGVAIAGENSFLKKLKDPESGEKFITSLKKDYDEESDELSEIIGNDKLDVSIRIRAIRLVAIYRMEKPVPILLKYLMSIRPLMKSEAQTKEMAYPCSGALIKIGKKGSIASIQSLKTCENKNERELLCYIIEQIEGKEVAIFMLQKELERTETDIEKENLQAALEYIKK